MPNKRDCPYEKHITDEVSGVEVPNRDYQVWNEGYAACAGEIPKMIKKANKQSGTALCFYYPGRESHEK